MVPGFRDDLGDEKKKRVERFVEQNGNENDKPKAWN